MTPCHVHVFHPVTATTLQEYHVRSYKSIELRCEFILEYLPVLLIILILFICLCTGFCAALGGADVLPAEKVDSGRIYFRLSRLTRPSHDT